ncbi:hypothetical protein INS49_013317 [Diaporthe citri]|uniref:uncharacterized protein n=1 Tax=Diaporthe citri TaxID=83186 RepID=UPI001C80FFB9|nr:uncharacterized protein INS49_013317 [Diaporthe citri]KAG6357440.1 hypothetical protein INS49_013317 [Diaporthe citri]
MAETLGVVSGIIAVADLTYTVLGYLKSVHDAGKDIEDYNREAPDFTELLTSLAVHVAKKVERFKKKVAPGTGLREKLTQRITWKFVKDDVKEILEKMERLNSLIVIALQKDHFKLSEAIHSITSKIKNDTAVIRATGEHHTTELATLVTEAHKQSALSSAILQNTSQIESIHAEAGSTEHAKHKAQLMEWLSDHGHIKEQQDNVSRCKEGTGMRLLHDPKFKEWESGTLDTLFCVGTPGAGKTVMSAMVVRHLFQTPRVSTDEVAVAFLYFRYDLRDTQSTERLLGSLIRQLAAVDSFSCVYFVVDALDEGAVQHTKGLISTIRCLRKARIKLLATSRFIPEIQAQFEDDHSIEIRGSDVDIESYTTDRLSELPRCVQNNLPLQTEITQAIVTSTQGMFLLAKLHIDSLKDKRTLKAMRSTLGTLPSGSSAYDTAYDGAMKRISDQSESDYKLAQQVLAWLVHAKRPISEIDLEAALAVELGERYLDPDNIVPVMELLSLCAGLVALDKEL